MTHSWLPTLPPFPPADSFGWIALDLAIKATALIALAASLVLLCGRGSAALRHRIWAILFVALLLLPAFGVALPGWDWKVIPQSWQAATPAPLTAHVDSTPAMPQPVVASVPVIRNTVPDEPMPAAAEAAMQPDTVAASPQKEGDLPAVVAQAESRETQATSSPVSPLAAAPRRASVPWLAIAWLGGAFVALLPLAFGLLANAFLRRQSPVLSGADWRDLLERSSRQVGLSRKVRLLSAGPRQMPMTFGVWRPCVVLPADAGDWSMERREIVLLHELSHIARHDVPLQMVARLACAVYWFHPLAWWALRQMRVEREHACDDHVLRAGQAAPDYAQQLLEIARAHSRSSMLLNAALSMARPSQLEGRLLAVLDENRSRRPLGAISTGGSAAVALALVLALAIVRPTLEAKSPRPAESGSSITAQSSPAQDGHELVLTGVVLGPDGKPLSSATVEAIAIEGMRWAQRPSDKSGIDIYQTKTDGSGRFRVSVPHSPSRPRPFLMLVASDESHHFAALPENKHRPHADVQLRCEPSKTVTLQFVDSVGDPVSGIEPNIDQISMKSGWAWHPRWASMPAGWPRLTRTDEKGYASAIVPASTNKMTLSLDDERVGAQQLDVNLSKEPVSVSLKSARFLNGKVVDNDNGQPIAGAEVMMMEQPFHSVFSKTDGSFRIASGSTVQTMFRQGECTIHIYPPSDSRNLFKAIEWTWPNEGIGDANLLVRLKRGQLAEGEVVEKGSGKPLAGATIWYSPQQRGNRFFQESARSRFGGADMKYSTDSQGRFRLTVMPGPGYLLVNAPTLDYVHQQLSEGHRWDGKEGLAREYYDGFLKLRLTQGEHVEGLKIELERGVTLRRRVTLPDGKPVKGTAFARSYLEFTNDINQQLPAIPIEEGLLELPGCDPTHPNPVFLVDDSGKFGATVSLVATEPEDHPIALQPCGQARFRFVDEQGKPLVGYEPMPVIVVTPGAPATHFIESNQPLWLDSLNWNWDQRLKTDADGRVTVSKLLPGATYRLAYVDKDRWSSGHEFQVRSGETTDVGQIVLSRRK
jgi:beta-lactamase regulating signal transducer with metallopeptidase domain